MQDTINVKIKGRESFRPFAPSVLAEHAAEWFAPGAPSPYMLFTAEVKRREIPAVTHVDGSARVQTVDGQTNPRYHALLTKFFEKTQCPVLLNTSFNMKDEPIVCTPSDALKCFRNANLDVLVIGNILVYK